METSQEGLVLFPESHTSNSHLMTSLQLGEADSEQEEL